MIIKENYFNFSETIYRNAFFNTYSINFFFFFFFFFFFMRGKDPELFKKTFP
jgi:hypothetical protein